LVLENNGDDALTLNADGPFTFSNALPPGSSYLVTVQSQPATQTCTVTNGSGTITNANVTNVTVNCSTNTRTVGGTVSGLAASESVVLQNNGGDNLTVNSNGSFTFSTSVAQGATYNVTVLTQPATQTCTVTYYAAGLCKQTIATYSDWYLPAICEMGYGSNACGTSAAPTLQNIQTSLIDTSGLSTPTGIYWSSTQSSSDPQFVWNQTFSPSDESVQFAYGKYYQFGVRCSRALTL
jgi:hypothetical protein